MTLGQRFARLVTDVVVRVPLLWRVFRAPLTRNFDRLAPEWDATRVSRERLAPMVAALDVASRRRPTACSTSAPGPARLRGSSRRGGRTRR